jgi:hypothetical protein
MRTEVDGAADPAPGPDGFAAAVPAIGSGDVIGPDGTLGSASDPATAPGRTEDLIGFAGPSGTVALPAIGTWGMIRAESVPEPCASRAVSAESATLTRFAG